MIKHEHCISGNMNVKNGEDFRKKNISRKKKQKIVWKRGKRKEEEVKIKERRGGQLQFTFKS